MIEPKPIPICQNVVKYKYKPTIQYVKSISKVEPYTLSPNNDAAVNAFIKYL